MGHRTGPLMLGRGWRSEDSRPGERLRASPVGLMVHPVMYIHILHPFLFPCQLFFLSALSLPLGFPSSPPTRSEIAYATCTGTAQRAPVGAQPCFHLFQHWS